MSNGPFSFLLASQPFDDLKWEKKILSSSNEKTIDIESIFKIEFQMYANLQGSIFNLDNETENSSSLETTTEEFSNSILEATNWFINNILHCEGQSCYLYLGEYKRETMFDKNTYHIIILVSKNLTETNEFLFKQQYKKFRTSDPVLIILPHIASNTKIKNLRSFYKMLNRKKSENQKLLNYNLLSALSENFNFVTIFHLVCLNEPRKSDNHRRQKWNEIIGGNFFSNNLLINSLVASSDKQIKYLGLVNSDHIELPKNKLYESRYGLTNRLTSTDTRRKVVHIKPFQKEKNENVANIQPVLLKDYELVNIKGVGEANVTSESIQNALSMLSDSFNNPTYSNQNGNNLNKSKFEGFLAISLFQNLKWRMKQPNQLNNDEYGLKKEINVDIDQVLILY